MRIQKVRIQNFRCLEDVEIAFDEVTTFLGPNGAGKSTILHALNWFFNGTRQDLLTIEDVFQRDATRAVDVAVQFADLTDADRTALGKYAIPTSDSVTIRKSWWDGTEKVIGRSRVYPPFEVIRAGTSATERKALYQELRAVESRLELPAWTNDGAGMETLARWEADHPEELEDADVESATHFFGFAGQAMMSGLFDFIFVSADLRASEEATDSRSAMLGRILAQAIDRSSADAEITQLLEEVSAQQATIRERHFGSQLTTLSDRLTDEVSVLATGREVRIVSQSSSAPAADKTQFMVNVVDRDLDTRVDRQGHGFQRALLIAGLKVLAESSRRKHSTGTICLGIEEPELYQHPLQARLFAAVLRGLAEDRTRGVQVTYATHSPYFIEAKSFHQIRRVTQVNTPHGHFTTRILGSTIGEIAARLDGYVEPERIRRQLDGVCMHGLAEGFFAEVVLLVEGTTDRAVLTGVAARDSKPLLLDGIYVGEAGGKTSLLLPHVILQELGIPVYMVADNDSHLAEQLDEATEAGDLARVRQLKQAVQDSTMWNRKILRFFGRSEEDWPTGAITPTLTFVDGGLEQALEEMWPAWAEARQGLVDSGTGFSGKDRATYEEAAIHASGDVPPLLQALLDGAKALREAA